MSFPAFYDYFFIFFYYGFYKCKFLFFESMIIYQLNVRNIMFNSVNMLFEEGGVLDAALFTVYL